MTKILPPKQKVLAEPGRVYDWLRVNWAVVRRGLSLKTPKANGCEQLSVLLMSSGLQARRQVGGAEFAAKCQGQEMGADMELRARPAEQKDSNLFWGDSRRPETAAMSQTPGKLVQGCFRQNLLSILLAVPVVITNCFLRVWVFRARRSKLQQWNRAIVRGERNLPGQVRTWRQAQNLSSSKTRVQGVLGRCIPLKPGIKTSSALP